MKKLILLGVVALSPTANAQDTMPPTITCPADVELAADENCTASYEGPAATATDDEDAMPAIGPMLPVPLAGPGPHVITHTATDDAGNMTSCDQTVTVIDATAPVVVSAEATPACLWPPNHKMVEFRAGEGLLLEAIDNCDAAPALSFSASSNEDEDGRGDGHTAPDFLAGEAGFCLRSERSGGGSGRVYTVEVRAVDAAGNSSGEAALVEVRVPHDQSAHDCPQLNAFVDDETTCGTSGGGDGGVGAETSSAACSLSGAGRPSWGLAFLFGLLLAARRRHCSGRPGTK